MRGRTVVSVKGDHITSPLQVYPELPTALRINSGFSSGWTHRPSHSEHACRGPSPLSGLFIAHILSISIHPGPEPLLVCASAVSSHLANLLCLLPKTERLSPSCFKVRAPKSLACHFPTPFVSPPQSRAFTILLPLQRSWEPCLSFLDHPCRGSV